MPCRLKRFSHFISDLESDKKQLALEKSNTYASSIKLQKELPYRLGWREWTILFLPFMWTRSGSFSYLGSFFSCAFAIVWEEILTRFDDIGVDYSKEELVLTYMNKESHQALREGQEIMRLEKDREAVSASANWSCNWIDSLRPWRFIMCPWGDWSYFRNWWPQLIYWYSHHPIDHAFIEGGCQCGFQSCSDPLAGNFLALPLMEGFDFTPNSVVKIISLYSDVDFPSLPILLFFAPSLPPLWLLKL